MPNFDPNSIVAQITDLATRVENLEGAIAGKNSVTVTDGVDCADDIASLVGDFVPQVKTVLALIQPLLPIIPVLVERFSGEAAGTGGTLESAAVMPADQLGKYDPATGKVAAPKTGE